MSAHEANKKAAERIKRNIPKFRRAPPKLPAMSDDRHAAEKRMLDEVLGGPKRSKHRMRRRSLEGVPGQRKKGAAGAMSGGNSDLITQLTRRLGKLEKAQYMHRDEMVRKDREILKLKRKIMALESVTEGKQAAVSEIENLRSENMHLRQQVKEMEQFLNDYGLVWVGDTSASAGEAKTSSSSSSSRKAGAAGAGAGAGAGAKPKPNAFKVDMGLLMNRVKELNAAAGEGKHDVAQVNGVHRLKVKESVRIAVYNDGILVKRGPFRSFADHKSARQFINDIMDGYFPSEFKKTYPDGVVLDVVDKSSADFNPTTFKPFSGKGAAIGDSPSNIKSFADMGDGNFQMRKKDFLNNLPASVLRGGKVIPVRQPIAEMMGEGGEGKRSDVVLVQTPVVDALQDDSGRPITPADVTTLRIKSQSGTQTLMVKLRYTDTIADVKAAVDKHRSETTPYELRTPFPRKAYTDPAQTLADAGLVPNATLIVHVVA